MKVLVAVLLCLLSVLAQAQTNEACLKWALWKEARGEGIVTQRAVLDVIEARMEKSGKNACRVLRAKQQFPYFKYGVKKVDFQFSVRYTVVTRMQRVVSKDYLFFNHYRHPWGKSTKKVGNLYFSQ